jgi:L-methionine (R)-S-oxide reductase
MSKTQVLGALKSLLLLDAPREVRAKHVAEIIRASGPYRWVGIYDVDLERGTVSNMAWSGPGPPMHLSFPTTQGLTSRAIKKKSTINVGDVAHDSDYLPALGNTQSEIILPVLDKAGKRVIGTIDVESEQRDAFGEGTQQLFEQYAKALRPLWMTRLRVRERPRSSRRRS